MLQNFNLIAINESHAVERLTRIALLLTKITILFLPVTLSTSYFSTDLIDAQFTVQSFWIAFGVILICSVFMILIFEAYSDLVEGKTNYRPLAIELLSYTKHFWKKRRGGNKKRNLS